MPELPLVERYRREADQFLVNRTVASASSVMDDMMMPSLSPRRFMRVVTGRRIDAVHRRGKYLWLHFDRAPHLVLHFGMTGEFVYDPVTRPKHWRLKLSLDNGGTLYLADPRRFGRVLLVHDPLHEPPISKLGFDPWLDRISTHQFTAAVQRRSAPIKAILLDQSFAAGVGNWIADDALYLARISPRRCGASLSPAQCSRLLRQLVSVVRIATKAGSYGEKFPKKWLFHLRWGRNQGIKTPSGDAVKFEMIGSRTTAWVPRVQK